MHIYIVSYDIRDPKRLRKVYRCMRGWGDHLQLSVFRCQLSKRDLVQLKYAISALIHKKEDQVLFIHLGPKEGHAKKAIYSLGVPYSHPERHAIIVD